ncbi:thiol-disulfide oxidoreductase DCC family protein [Micromonospora sp. NPDC048935]|uniref:thiol-disulfide oxidoreductase DCC family protein n=1 Tax=Micromonospora sp. NPDC048935 TaxID=3364262 RepID=UPI0037190532
MTVPPDHGVGRLPDPTAGSGGGIRGFTVLFDAACPLCRAARRWLSTRAQLVPLEFVPAGSAEARRRFPGLDHDATLRDLTVIADTGEVYAGDGAWFACLWALADHRSTAERLARPHLLPLARQAVATASAIRERVRDPWAEPTDDLAGYGGPDDRTACADDHCG